MKIIIPSLLLGSSIGGILISLIIVFACSRSKKLSKILSSLIILHFAILLMFLAENILKWNLEIFSARCLGLLITFVWFATISIFMLSINKNFFPAYCLLSIGIAMNTITMLANNGMMPVYTSNPNAIEHLQQSRYHFDAKGQEVAFVWLTDWIAFSDITISPGDILIIGSGIFLLIFCLVKRAKVV